MGLPLSSVLLLVVPPAVLFAVALVHLLRAPRDDEAPAAAAPEPGDGPTPKTSEDAGGRVSTRI